MKIQIELEEILAWCRNCHLANPELEMSKSIECKHCFLKHIIDYHKVTS